LAAVVQRHKTLALCRGSQAVVLINGSKVIPCHQEMQKCCNENQGIYFGLEIDRQKLFRTKEERQRKVN